MRLSGRSLDGGRELRKLCEALPDPLGECGAINHTGGNIEHQSFLLIDWKQNDQNFNFGSTAVRFGVDLAINRNDEASTKFIDDDGNADFEDFSRSTYYPKWRGQLGLRAQVEDFRFTWVVNYTGKAPQYGPDVDEFDDILGNAGTGFLSDTCLGPPDDVYCRDYADIDEYWLHSASLYWYGDTITIGAGIRNVFDEAPPRVDGDEVLAINNVPIGSSYDLFGRTYFFNLIWRP